MIDWFIYQQIYIIIRNLSSLGLLERLSDCRKSLAFWIGIPIQSQLGEGHLEQLYHSFFIVILQPCFRFFFPLTDIVLTLHLHHALRNKRFDCSKLS
jgi:hypothetical protein